MPRSALVTQLFSSLMRVYRSFPPVAPKWHYDRLLLVLGSKDGITCIWTQESAQDLACDERSLSFSWNLLWTAS